MRILVIDDHSLFVSGLRFLLSDLRDGVIVDEASRVDVAALRALEAPDLILLDLYLPGDSGMVALERVRSVFDATSIVVLSGEECPTLIRQCIEGGAAGFLPKSSSPDVMIHALRLVLAGGIYLPDLVLGGRARSSAAKPDRGGDVPTRAARRGEGVALQLSGRPLEALMLAVQGKSNKVIAREMGIAEGTVKLHLSTAFRLLQVANRTEAVFEVARLGLAQTPAQ